MLRIQKRTKLFPNLSTNEGKQLYQLKIAFKVFMTNLWLVKSN